MNKICGIKSDFSYKRSDRSRFIIGYNLQQVDELHYTWNEIYFYKTKVERFDSIDIKNAIIEDINKGVVEKITSGFKWNNNEVWLSVENQMNYKTAYDLAVLSPKEFLPVTFKFGTDENPVYYIFNDIDDLEDFYIAMTNHITNAILEGWKLKDSIDWSAYGIESSNDSIDESNLTEA